MPLFTHWPGRAASDARWTIAWYVVWLTRYGKTPIGDLSRKRTAYFPAADTPAASKYGERPALDSFAPTYCLKLATTSRDVISCPSWKRTPFRSWKVHTVAFAFGFQLVASHGRIRPWGSVNVRYSPGIPDSASAPPSFRRYGSSEPPAGRPTRIVPPRFTCSSRCTAGAAPASPTRPSRPPMMPAEIPNIAPRFRNSPRSSSPANSSSMTLFSSGPASLRRYSSIALLVSLSIRPPRVVGARRAPSPIETHAGPPPFAPSGTALRRFCTWTRVLRCVRA